MSNVALKHVEMFAAESYHLFKFHIDPGNAAAFEVPVVVDYESSESLNALWAHAHENLVTILEQTLERARGLAVQFRAMADASPG